MGGFFYGTDKNIQTEDIVSGKRITGGVWSYRSIAVDTGAAASETEPVRRHYCSGHHGHISDFLLSGRIPPGKRSAEKQISVGTDTGGSIFHTADHNIHNRQPWKLRGNQPVPVHLFPVCSGRNDRRNAVLKNNQKTQQTHQKRSKQHPKKKTL